MSDLSSRFHTFFFQPLLLLGFTLALVLTFSRQDTPHTARIVVNTLEDELNTDGDCSLREAIVAADNDAPSDNCIPGKGEDSITFTVTGTITLSTTLPTITDLAGLTIDGSGRIIISGANTVRHVQVYPDAVLTLEGLALIEGSNDYFGGALYNGGGVTQVRHTTFSDNAGGSYGGAIFNSQNGSLNVENSTFSRNSASVGGGAIVNTTGFVTISGTTFISNSVALSPTVNLATAADQSASHLSGGGIGGAVLTGEVLHVVNSTFSGNVAAANGGGIFNGDGTATVSHSTFFGNSALEGGGLYHQAGTITLFNNILAGSMVGGDCESGDGAVIVDGGGNLVEDGSCGFPAGGDPLLGPLADNGGPTLTYLPAQDSPAVDMAEEANCATLDQRGLARPIDGDGDGSAACDIGAVERDVPPPVPVITIFLPLVLIP